MAQQPSKTHCNNTNGGTKCVDASAVDPTFATCKNKKKTLHQSEVNWSRKSNFTASNPTTAGTTATTSITIDPSALLLRARPILVPNTKVKSTKPSKTKPAGFRIRDKIRKESKMTDATDPSKTSKEDTPDRRLQAIEEWKARNPTPTTAAIDPKSPTTPYVQKHEAGWKKTNKTDSTSATLLTGIPGSKVQVDPMEATKEEGETPTPPSTSIARAEFPEGELAESIMDTSATVKDNKDTGSDVAGVDEGEWKVVDKTGKAKVDSTAKPNSKSAPNTAKAGSTHQWKQWNCRYHPNRRGYWHRH